MKAKAPEHVGYALQWGNLMDVGGKSAGSIPIDARSIFEEGVRMPPVKLYDGGKAQRRGSALFLPQLPYPARNSGGHHGDSRRDLCRFSAR